MGKFKWLIIVFVIFTFSGCSSKYQISFNTTGGQQIEEINNISKGETISLPIPTKEGYLFVGWYEDLLYSLPFTDESKVTNNVTLFAKWKLKKFKIEFVDNSDTNIEPIEVDYGVIVTEPIPTKTGYTFGGWYLDQAYQNRFVFNKMPASNLKLYSKWEPISYTITYMNNGFEVLGSTTCYFQDPLQLPTPEREGFNFCGWYKDLNLTQKFEEETMPSENITLYANWHPVVYQVTWIFDDDKYVNDKYFYKEELTPPNVNKSGHRFTGWYLDNEWEIPFNLTTCPATNLTVYARWEILKYKITLIDAQNVYLDLILNYNEKVIVTEPEKPGHTFLGWFYDQELNNPFDMMVPAKDITVYAGWKLNKYWVIFHENNGTEVIDIEDYYQNSFDFPIISKEGYIFNGWFLDNELTIPFLMNPKVPNYDLHLYAKWEPSGHWKYQIRENRIVITGFVGTPSVLEIPSKINNKIVTRIEDESFFNFTSLVKVIIPDTVYYIGKDAFRDCSNLKEVTLPQNLTEIASNLFSGCVNLENITLPPTIKIIGNNAFNGCLNLQEVELSILLEVIGENAFRNCEKLSYINLPDSIEIIKQDAFNDCLALKTIIVPDKVIKYHRDAFANSAWYQSSPEGVIYLGKMVYGYKGILPNQVIIEAGTLGINDNAFYNSSTLKAIITPDTLIYIGDYAFAECRNLQFILFTDVIEIGSYVFKNCYSLYSIIFPNCTSIIGEEPFTGCSDDLIIYTSYDNVDRLLSLLGYDPRVRSIEKV